MTHLSEYNIIIITGTIPNFLKNLNNNYANNKKPNINSSKFPNYRTISQIPLRTNIHEYAVYTQLSHYLTEHMLLDIIQKRVPQTP